MSRWHLYGLICVALMGLALNPVQADLLLYYGFDEGTGDVVKDDSGHGYDGTMIEATWHVGGFDGTGACVDVAGGGSVENVEVADAMNGLEAVTVMLWVKSNVTGTDHGFINFIDPDGGDFGGMRYDAASWAFPGGTNVITIVMPTSGPRARIESANDLQVTEWQHIAMVWASGDGISLYVNGEQDTAPTGADAPGTGEVSGVQKLIVGKGGKNNAAGSSWDGLVDEVRIYDVALSAEAIQAAMWGTAAALANAPSPHDGASDVPRDTMLYWNPGSYAVTHNVYLGTSFDDVNRADTASSLGVLLGAGIDVNGVAPDRLDLGQTYYWRVDEVNGAPDYTVYEGEVWSFTVEPLADTIENVAATTNATLEANAGPENTVNGSGLNAADQHSTEAADMWLGSPSGADPVYLQYEFDRVYKLHEMLVWNYNVQFEPVLGFGLRGVTVEYSVDGTEWAVLGDVEFAQATATATYAANTTVDFGGTAAQYVRLTVNSGWGMIGQYGLSEVRFMYIPTFAREPAPGDGATGLDPATTLNWRAGREAGMHEIYLGTDPNALPLVDAVDETSYAADLGFGRTYYWQIVEVNEAEAPSAWAGDVWSFSTLEYVLIEGFETYDDDIDAGTTIFDTWIDGWVNETGSTVGYFGAPFAEQTIVRSGGQSMPLTYDNTASPFYSETGRVFDSAQDWTVNGADTLVMYFQGVPGPFAELPSGKIVLGAAGTDIWNTTDEFRFAHKQLSGNGSIVAYVESVANTNPWAKGGVMIRETLEEGSTFAAVYSTPGNGCRYQARLTTDVAAVSDTAVATAEQIALSAPHWVKMERVGNEFNGYYSTDGENWTSMSWNPQTIAMESDVYIGLALTSHAAGVLGSAEFSDVATTGNVNGQWTVATIGPEPPEGNAASPLYVTLEDAAGKSATVSHPAGDAAVILGGWNKWAIPMSEFVGVNLSRVEVMRIGVGNPASPTAGGTGIVYFDDIGYGRSAIE